LGGLNNLIEYLANVYAIFIGGILKNRLTAKEGKIEKNRLGCFQCRQSS